MVFSVPGLNIHPNKIKPAKNCSYILAAILGQVLYRRWLHPLSKYPGPWLESVSSIPSAIVAYRGI